MVAIYVGIVHDSDEGQTEKVQQPGRAGGE